MLSAQAKRALVVALGYRTKLADEFELALFTRKALSAALKRNIIDAMAKLSEANEVINCLQTIGTVPLSAKALARLKVMLAGKGNLDTRALLNEILPLMVGAPVSSSPLSLMDSLMGVSKNFAVLASSTITNTGNTVITGDLGLSPGTSVTGFPPGTVSGTQHINDAAAAQGQVDLSAAYALLAALVPTQDLSGQDLGGLTLLPGIYNFSSSAALTGVLTLDAAGDANAHWVFKIGSTLTTATSSSVVLINGGQADNVAFQVGSSATLGVSSAFKGSILAQASITADGGAGATSNRLLARTAAVTFAAITLVSL